MEKASKAARLSREDWVNAALEVLRERGVGGIKVVVLAEKITGNTT